MTEPNPNRQPENTAHPAGQGGQTETAGQPESPAAAPGVAGQPPADTARKKRRSIIIWIRVTALLFAGFFFLSQCGMSKPRARAAIIGSCIQNVPFAPKWQADLKQRSLADPEGRLAERYCICMWDEPLQKLNYRQIQSFAQRTPQQQLELLGGEKAFVERDKKCLEGLKRL